jgi:signal transduction histidine kinase/DNA-binding response OmpR family regulator
MNENLIFSSFYIFFDEFPAISGNGARCLGNLGAAQQREAGRESGVPMIPQDTLSALAGLAVVLGALGAVYWVCRSLARRSAARAERVALRDEITQLRAAAAGRDRAEAASLAKSRFLASVSHEIRTPLNGILGLAQLLAMTRLSAEQTSYVEAIRDCSRSLAQLIDDILDFSKIEAGKIEIRRDPFPLAPVIEGVVELLAPRAQGKNLEISSFIAPDAPKKIVGDAARVRQVLINLIGNAVNFTQTGGVGLRVFCGEDDELMFEVSDTGPGIPAHARQNIFEEFEQVDSSASRPHKGAGLGLAISRRIARRMGGRLELVESSERGSKFVFALPLATLGRVPGEEGQAPTSKRLDGARVLIVARSVFEAPFLAATLKSAGADAEIAEGVNAGLARLAQEPPETFDAVITDCELGEEATEHLAAAARTAQVGRVLLLFSALERRAFGEAALRHCDGWLVKPVRANSLIEQVAFEKTKSQPASAGPPEQMLRGLCVLVAEDNEINALIASRHLEKLGAKVHVAENGVKAVELARAAIDGGARPFDVILMDLFMPQLDGLEATQRIRLSEARARAAHTPILALTASALEEDERAARAAGVDALLTKPVDFDTLGQTIEQLCANKPRAAAAE